MNIPTVYRQQWAKNFAVLLRQFSPFDGRPIENEACDAMVDPATGDLVITVTVRVKPKVEEPDADAP